MSVPDQHERIVNRKVFWTMWVVGTSIMGFGVWGLIANASKSSPPRWLGWFVGVLVAHDFIVAPAVFAVGSVIRKRVTGSAKALLQAAIAASAVLAVISIPAVGGFGRNPHNLSILPLNYAHGLAMVLAVVWAFVLFVLIVIGIARRSRRRADGPVEA